MARPRKAGLDYFPFDIDFFQDEKIVCIAGEFGIKGEMVAIRLLCAIYNKGYFAEWNEQQKYKLSKEMQGVSADLIEQIVRRLAKWGFFDKALLDSASILTSRSIQRRYFEATKKLRRIGRLDDDYIKPEYIIDTSVINAEETAVSSEKTPVSSLGNTTNKNKLNKTKIKRESYDSQKSGEEEEKNLKDRIEKYKKDEEWKKDIAEKHRLHPEDVPALLDAFHLDMRCKRLYVKNLPYFFDGWLNKMNEKKNEEKDPDGKGRGGRTDPRQTPSSVESDIERLDRQKRERDEAHREMVRNAVKPADYIRSLGYDPQKVNMLQVRDPEWRASHPPTLPIPEDGNETL